MSIQESTNVETLQAKGSQIIDAVKDLIHEGNVRRITIRHDGSTLAEFPLTLGVVGAAIAPALAAVGAIAALVTECTIEVERVPDPDGMADNPAG
jgi:Domain of unknown function (DUF4342)